MKTTTNNSLYNPAEALFKAIKKTQDALSCESNSEVPPKESNENKQQ